MTQYKVLDVESKSPDWRVITIQELGGRTIENVSVNRFKKDSQEDQWNGEFENIAPDKMIEGEYWKSPSGKQFLFPPKKAGAVPGFKGGAGVKAAQERKGEMIEKAQENKMAGIMISSAMRAATDILVNSYEFKNMSDDEIQGKHKFWRKWYISQWNQELKDNDIPF